MSNIAKQHIFVVDDELSVCEAMCEILEKFGAEVTCFTSAAECLGQLPSERCDLLITDLKMPEMDGIELVTNVKHIAPLLPIMIVTGYGDIPNAVRAIKAGAVDFIEKPLQKSSFVAKVESILQRNFNHGCLNSPLTPREFTVLRLVVKGKTSREISSLLNRSQRTVDVHRAHIMRKLGADNLVDLLKRSAAMGLFDEPDSQRPRQKK